MRSAIGGRTIVDELMQRPDGADDRGEAFVTGAMAHIKLGNASGAAEYLAAGKSWGDGGPKLVVKQILDSLDRDTVLRDAKREIQARLGLS